MWTLIGILGLGLLFGSLRAVVLDYLAVLDTIYKSDIERQQSLIVSWAAVRRELAALTLMIIVTLLGVIGLFSRPNQAPTMAGWFIIGALFIAEVSIPARTLLDWRDRNRFNKLKEE